MAFYGYVMMLTSPMRTLGVSLGMAQRAVASGARVFEILDRGPRLTAPPDAPALPEGGGRVEMRDVCFSYDGGEPVLDGLSTSRWRPGEPWRSWAAPARARRRWWR